MVCVESKQCYNKRMPNSIYMFLDIRGGSVGVAIIERGKNTEDTLLFSKRRVLPILNEFKCERLISTMVSEARELLLGVRKVNIGRIKKVYITIGSPWFFSETQTIIHKSDIPTKCDKNWLDMKIDEEVNGFILRNFNNRKPEIIEKVLLRTTLNGYQTDKPFGKLAQEQEFTLYLSAVETNTVNTIRRVVNDVFGSHQIEFHTMPLLALIAVDNLISVDINSYIIIDIGGEITEFILVRNKLIFDSFSVPLGVHEIIRTIAHDLKTSMAEGRSIYHSYQDATLGSIVKGKVEKSVSFVETKWRAYSKDIIKKISDKYILPVTVVIIGTHNSSFFFKKVFSNAEVMEMFPQHSLPNIILLSSENFKIKLKAKIAGLQSDIFTSVEISSIDKVNKFEYA